MYTVQEVEFYYMLGRKIQNSDASLPRQTTEKET